MLARRQDPRHLVAERRVIFKRDLSIQIRRGQGIGSAGGNDRGRVCSLKKSLK
jgi:hypothetical protein